MGCIHSTSTGRIKKHGADAGGIPVKADPEVHPEILQLAEVSALKGNTAVIHATLCYFILCPVAGKGQSILNLTLYYITC